MRIFLLITLFFLSSCNDTQKKVSESKNNELRVVEKTRKNKMINNKINLGEDLEEINCYVKKIYRKDNFTYAEIDIVQVIITPEGKRTIKNENPKVRTYIVDDNTITYNYDCVSMTPEKLPEIKQSNLDDKSIIVVGSSKNGILKSINFGCYG